MANQRGVLFANMRCYAEPHMAFLRDIAFQGMPAQVEQVAPKKNDVGRTCRGPVWSYWQKGAKSHRALHSAA